MYVCPLWEDFVGIPFPILVTYLTWIDIVALNCNYDLIYCFLQ